MATTYEAIATQTLGSDTTTVTFSSIASSWTDLILVADMTQASTGGIGLDFNSDTGTNYSYTQVYGDGSSASSNRQSNTDYVSISYTSSPSTRSLVTVHIFNYANTSTYKTVISRGATGTLTNATVNTWRSTSAINTVRVRVPGGINILTGSTFTLYGIKAA